MGKNFNYVEDPIEQAQETEGQTKLPGDFSKDLKASEKHDKEMSKVKSAEVKNAEPQGVAQWSTYENLAV